MAPPFSIFRCSLFSSFSSKAFRGEISTRTAVMTSSLLICPPPRLQQFKPMANNPKRKPGIENFDTKYTTLPHYQLYCPTWGSCHHENHLWEQGWASNTDLYRLDRKKGVRISNISFASNLVFGSAAIDEIIFRPNKNMLGVF